MATIAFDVAIFRGQFPAFSDSATYPDAVLQGNWELATCIISDNDYGCIVGDCRRRLLNAVTAHVTRYNEIVMAGDTPGFVSSATIDSVSVTKEVPPKNTEQWKWWLNTTPYGSMALSILSVASAAGLYVGGNNERSAIRRVGGGFGFG